MDSMPQAVGSPDLTYCLSASLSGLVVSVDKFQFGFVRTMGVDPAQRRLPHPERCSGAHAQLSHAGEPGS